MAKKKSSSKSSGKASPKRSQSKQSQNSKATEKKFVTSKTPRSVPRVLRPLKESKHSKQAVSKPAVPKERNFLKTKTYKAFAKQYKRRADKDYWKAIQNQWKELYDKKKQPVRIVMINIEKKFIRNTKNRMVETKIKYLGREKWRKGTDGKWKEGKVHKRNLYRDKLQGNYVKGKKVGVRFLKIMEKDLVRKYMKKHRIKNYNKAKKKFWKETETKSIHTIVKLYGGSP